MPSLLEESLVILIALTKFFECGVFHTVYQKMSLVQDDFCNVYTQEDLNKYNVMILNNSEGIMSA
jgi:hypothetical protein